jgi:hypothetical protein
MLIQLLLVVWRGLLTFAWFWQVTHVETICEETDSIKMLLDQRAGDWGLSHEEHPSVAVSLYSIALNCIEDNKRKRPNMTVVLECLEENVGFIT